MSLSTKLLTLNVPALPKIKTGNDDTIAEFWNDFVVPLLPPKQAVIDMYRLLLRYVEDEDPRITYAIRNFANTQGGKKNYITLRRGFLTLSDSYRYFFTDNFFAAYFYKMALDGYVPNYNEFKEAMLSREFPARFGPFDKKYEWKKAAYSIDGKKGKNPGFADAGYKLSHIIDSGKGYLINGKTMSVTDWCEEYGFDRGDYDKYALRKDSYGSFYARIDPNAPGEARDVLKAQFLRLACPLNHVLTPKVGKNRCHVLGQGVHAKLNDIGEMEEFQLYAMAQMKAMYGNVYDDYLSQLMLASPQGNAASNLGSTYIGIRYGYKIGASASKKQSSAQNKSSQRSSNPNRGHMIQYKGQSLSGREYVLVAIKDYIATYNVASLSDLLARFPSIAKHASNIDVKRDDRFHPDVITLPSGEKIRITNQVGFSRNLGRRNLSYIIKTLEDLGIR